jgi:hypothetical protein
LPDALHERRVDAADVAAPDVLEELLAAGLRELLGALLADVLRHGLDARLQAETARAVADVAEELGLRPGR